MQMTKTAAVSIAALLVLLPGCASISSSSTAQSFAMNGEPDNARACFRNAQLQDSDTESREYANDWVLMDYLDGLVTTRYSGDGSDAYQRAQKSFKLGKLPEYSRTANTMVFLEFGQG